MKVSPRVFGTNTAHLLIECDCGTLFQVAFRITGGYCPKCGEWVSLKTLVAATFDIEPQSSQGWVQHKRSKCWHYILNNRLLHTGEIISHWITNAKENPPAGDRACQACTKIVNRWATREEEKESAEERLLRAIFGETPTA